MLFYVLPFSHKSVNIFVTYTKKKIGKERLVIMSNKETKQRIGLAKGEAVSVVQMLVILFVVIGCIMLFFGSQQMERYKNLKYIEEVTLDQLQENMYVKGNVDSTLCCYGTYELYDCYVVPIGVSGEEDQQYITVFADIYNSVKLEELPTYDYVREEVGTAKKDSAEERMEIFGVIKKLPEGSINYDYLKQQLGIESKKEIDSIVSGRYYIQIAKEENVGYWSECGIVLLFCAILLYVFFVIPNYRKRALISKEEDYANLNIRKETKQKVTTSIQHFVDHLYDNITIIIVEHLGNIVQISADTEISAILNCFLRATYDKVYEDYVSKDNLYIIQFVMKNGEIIESAMNSENVIFWYGSLNKMDPVSYSKLKKIFNNNHL